MKTLFVVVWLLANTVLCFADTNSVEPAILFKRDGFLAITDGNSYYVFRTNGTFISVPVGMSGRTFAGTCTSRAEPDKIAFTVHATKGWQNGPTSPDEYRIIFVIHGGGSKRRVQSFLPGAPRIDEVYDGYFLIEELVKILKPNE